ncbi:PEP-CTERM sorting domain-containing protein [Kiritimatiellota bacterium B12222]|nr:PEP-CTERM sorting domain-containing protein [Kiritimatiellota bacterium B12222]
MKNKFIILLAVLGLASVNSWGAVIDLTNSGTGAELDAIGSSVPGSFNLPEIPSLEMTVTAVLGNDSPSLNATAASLGVNSAATTGAGDDTDQFDALFEEGFIFEFDKDVSITEINFISFGSSDSFSFGGTSITFSDPNLDDSVYTFSAPFVVTAGTSISAQVTNGSIGMESMTLTVIPEPSSMVLMGLVGLAAVMMLKKRKK